MIGLSPAPTNVLSVMAPEWWTQWQTSIIANTNIQYFHCRAHVYDFHYKSHPRHSTLIQLALWLSQVASHRSASAWYSQWGYKQSFTHFPRDSWSKLCTYTSTDWTESQRVQVRPRYDIVGAALPRIAKQSAILQSKIINFRGNSIICACSVEDSTNSWHFDYYRIQTSGRQSPDSYSTQNRPISG